MNHVTEPASTASLGIVFVLDYDVMRQICHHGMIDSDKTVSNKDTSLFTSLLVSRCSSLEEKLRRRKT